MKGLRRLRDMRRRLSLVTPLPIAVKTSRHTVTLAQFGGITIEPTHDWDLTDGEIRTVGEAVDRVIAQHRELYIELVMQINPKIGLDVLDGVAAEEVLVKSLNELGDRMAKRLPTPGLLDNATVSFEIHGQAGGPIYQFDYSLDEDLRRMAWAWLGLPNPTMSITGAYYLARNCGAFMRWYTEVSIQLSRLSEIKNTIESA